MAMSSANNHMLDGEDDPPTDARLLVKWLEGKVETFQIRFTKQKFQELLGNAAQPRHASGNACINLCYFIEQCRKSNSPVIQEIPYSSTTCLDLFNFYLEWNEKNQNRSMRQVLELLASLISQNSQMSQSSHNDLLHNVKGSIISRIISIICHQDSQPLVKPAFKSLECFLSKATITPEILVVLYEKRSNYEYKNNEHSGVNHAKGSLTRWDSLISEIFDWLTLPDVSPAAGKCLVTLFGQVKNSSQVSDHVAGDYALLWQRWIRNGLIRNPEILDSVKNYLFPPLFKVDRAGSLAFLEDLNKQTPMSELKDQALGAHSLLQLAAIEVGKKAGLIEDPNTINFQSTKKTNRSIVLREDVIGPLMANAMDTVRSLAFSVLVSSSSTIRPFNAEALNFLRSGMAFLYADTDSRFRNDVLSNTKHLIERLRGATAYLLRELQDALFKNKQMTKNGSQQSERVKDLQIALKSHEDFLQWFLEFLLGELIPTASYQRHITALKAIMLLLKSGILWQDPSQVMILLAESSTSWPLSIKFFTSGAVRLLLDLVLDPFEDVRINAASVLKLAPRDCFESGRSLKYVELVCGSLITQDSVAQVEQLQTQDLSMGISGRGHSYGLLKHFISKAADVSKRTGRADYADGLARGYALLFHLLPTTTERLELVNELINDLERKTRIARKDLSRAVSDSPVHGTFAALSFIWETIDSNIAFDTTSKITHEKHWNDFHFRIFDCCSSIWLSVKDVLCNDSPEGHLPEDLDEVPNIDTKDVLSYSFRAVHESSNLMKTLISKIKDRRLDGTRILPTEVYISIGNLTFDQLSSLRHRGAFSTVSLTFARCCQLAQYQDANEPQGVEIIAQWYKGAIACIFEQASTTRRSAGIPALITGILSSNTSSPSFDEVVLELISVSHRPAKLAEKDQTSLPQVHAVNSLKEIFKSSILGKRAEGHTAECLQLAADSLNSEIWAIRNCGLLLLRSLIDSLFGTSESKAVTEAGWDGRSIRLSYERYPSLPDLLLKLLDTETSGSDQSTAPAIGAVESVFPALDIIRRAGPPSARRNEIYKLVSLHLGSRLWHVREIAARTICTLLLHQHWLRDILELLSMSGESSNRIHGTLMVVRFLLERRLLLHQGSATEGLIDIFAALRSPELQISLRHSPAEVKAAYVEIYNIFAKILLTMPQSPGDTALKRLFQAVTEEPITSHPLEAYLLSTHRDFSVVEENMTSDLTATLGNAIARRAVYVSAMKADFGMLQTVLGSINMLNIDIVLTSIETISLAWGGHGPSNPSIDIATAYLSVIRSSKSPEVTTAAIECLSEIVDGHLAISSHLPVNSGSNADETKTLEKLNEISELGNSIMGFKDTPSLVNARIRISGAVHLFADLENSTTHKSNIIGIDRLESWGAAISSAGDSHNDFDTRYAGVMGLATFYGNIHVSRRSLNDHSCIPSLFALYDSLNDDDDEIRDISATTASRLLEKSLVPLAASVELARWIDRNHHASLPYAWNVVCRIAGHSIYTCFETTEPALLSAETHLRRALQDDDSLFVEEEQNLFIDEVRETKLWCEIFAGTGSDEQSSDEIKETWLKPHKKLATWALDGLKYMNQLLENEDGPLGWTSKPSVFAVCMRVVLAAGAGICFSREPFPTEGGGTVIRDIAAALNHFVDLGSENKVHERILSEVNKILVFINGDQGDFAA